MNLKSLKLIMLDIRAMLTLGALQPHGTDGQCEPIEVSVLSSDQQRGHDLLLLPQQHTVLLGNMPNRLPVITLNIKDAFCTVFVSMKKTRVCW